MKKVISLILCVIIAFSLSAAVFASETHIYDYASLLTAEESSLLEEKATKISEKYSCEADIVTVYGMNGLSREAYAEQFFWDNNLGYGEEKSCVMLFIDMESRQYDITAYGYGNTAFTDYGKEAIKNEFVGYLSSGNFYSAFDVFLDCSEILLENAVNGEPIDVQNNSSEYGVKEGSFSLTGLAIGIVVGFVIAFLICEGFKAQMKTAKIKTEANDYESESGLRLTRRDDTFVNASVTRVKIVHDDDNNHGSFNGGGGTTINSGGFSHSGGSF